MSELWSLLAYGDTGWGDEILAGAGITIALALCTLPGGLMLGLLIALAKQSQSRVLQALGNIYTTVFRGLPELLTLFIIYYGGQILIQRAVELVSPDTVVEINSFVAGMIALGAVFGAFSSEVFLGAFRAVDRGQLEAGKAFGMSPRQVFWRINMPQVIRLALPGLGNNWMILLKDTSLVSVIALDDLLRKTNIAVGVTKEPFFFYAVACAIYLIFTIISNLGTMEMERRVSRGVRRA